MPSTFSQHGPIAQLPCIEIWRSKQSRDVHGASVGHVEQVSARVRRALALVQHLARVVVKHHSPNKR
eukprot:3599791-Pleurochrysis_carterae.AAC.4